ncbi:hypothetical protein ES703_79907 [subsurface metagenome]
MSKPRHSIRLPIPTINDALSDFDKLFELWGLVKGCSSNVTFDFSECDFLRPNAVAFLGGLARLVEHRRHRVEFDWHTANDKILAILRQNGFAGAFGYMRTLGGPGSSIPYREDLTCAAGAKNDVINYLKFNWLGNGWVRVSSKLRDAIVGRVWEIYDNAFLHSESTIGVFSCGQFFWRMGLLKLSVVDFGVGIPASLRRHLKAHPFVEHLTAAQCLRWAFQQGSSTKHDTTRRGNGLVLLKEFINVNHGRLEIYSQDGYALIEGGKEKFNNRRIFFQGTLVNITLRCDKKYYQLVDEGPSGPLF